MCKGFVKIPRRIYEEKQWNVKRVYSELDAFCDIYASANMRDRTEPDGTKVKRNQLLVSLRSLADKWIWSHSKVRRFLLALERKAYIKVDFSDSRTVITIIDFGADSSVDSDIVTVKKQSETPSETPPETLLKHQNPDKHRGFSMVSETPPETPPETPSETASRAYKNDNYISYLTEEYKKEDIIDSSLHSESLSTGVDPEDSVEPQGIVDFYNQTVKGTSVSKCIRLTDKRRKAIIARVREYGIDSVYEAITMVANSSFCNGSNNRNWTADFDFVFNVNNMAKILEGKYNNHATTQTNQGTNQGSEHPTDSELREQSVRLMQRLADERHARQTEVRQRTEFPTESQP